MPLICPSYVSSIFPYRASYSPHTRNAFRYYCILQYICTYTCTFVARKVTQSKNRLRHTKTLFIRSKVVIVVRWFTLSSSAFAYFVFSPFFSISIGALYPCFLIFFVASFLIHSRTARVSYVYTITILYVYCVTCTYAYPLDLLYSYPDDRLDK